MSGPERDKVTFRDNQAPMFNVGLNLSIHMIAEANEESVTKVGLDKDLLGENHQTILNTDYADDSEGLQEPTGANRSSKRLCISTWFEDQC